MAIELIEDLKTVRTYPRLMKNRHTGAIVMTLADGQDGGGIVYLNGTWSGQYVPALDVVWETFADFHGSVNLHNKD